MQKQINNFLTSLPNRLYTELDVDKLLAAIRKS